MNIFKEIREFFWPLLEKGEESQSDSLDISKITVDNTHLEKTLEYAIDCYNAESDRKKSIESKASMFIGTISIITSVILGVTSILVKENEFDITICALTVLLFFLTIYMSRAIWFSAQTLERRNYYSISVSDFLLNDPTEIYYKKIIAEVVNKTNKNALTINKKVDSMTMAQEYFKRAIVVVSLYSFVILLLFLSKSGVDFSTNFKTFISLINSIQISGWNTLILYILSILAIILGIIAIRKNR